MRWLRLVSPFILSVCSIGSSAQIQKCTDGAGNITYSDMPCATAETSEQFDLKYHSVDEDAAKALAAERAREIEQRQAERIQAQSDESDRRRKDAQREIARRKTENYDPLKCADARSLIAAMRAREPVTYMQDASYAEYQQAADRYCED